MKKLLIALTVLFCLGAKAQGPVYNFYSSNQLDDTLYEYQLQMNNEDFTEQHIYRIFSFYGKHATHIQTSRLYLDSVPQTTASQSGIIVRMPSGEFRTFSGTFLTAEVDGSTTNELQTLSRTNGTVALSSGGSIHLPDSSATNEIELPSQTGNSGKVLSTNGSAASWTSVTAPGTNNFTQYSAGTVYTLTTSSAKVDFGTTDPTITITQPGTYLIYANIKIEYSGLTTALNTCNFKLRRTNNTATDLPNSTTNFNVPAVTLLTGTGGDVDIPMVIYTTANSNDVIEMYGNRSGGLTLGSINVGEASIVAVRLY